MTSDGRYEALRDMSDEDLLLRARVDPDAFSTFFERHAVQLERWARHHAPNPELASDITAEAFAQALASLHRFRPRTETPAVAWLYGIARNLVRGAARSQRVATAARRELGIPLELADEEASGVVERLDAMRAQPALVDALARLPAEQHEAVRLRVIDELPYDEVATILGCSQDAARTRVSRGLRALKLTLEGQAP